MKQRVRSINFDQFQPRIDEKGGKHCVNCDALLTGRRRKYCTDKCGFEFWAKYDWSTLRQKMILQSKFTCAKCGHHIEIKQESSSKHEPKFWIALSKFIVDHIIPIALGGNEFDESNLQVLCSPCNKKKTARDMKVIACERRAAKLDLRDFWAMVNRKTLDAFFASYGGKSHV